MNYLIKLNSSTARFSNKLAKKITSQSGITLSLLGVTLLTLSGCATTQSLTPQQCQTSDWEEIGRADGSVGRSGAYFGHYANSCASIGAATPNRELWEQGRQQGLENYCTELTAYKLGREGYDWQAVCPIEGIEKLEEAYSQGRYYYIRQQNLDYLRSPYPFGHSPFGHRYHPLRHHW